MKTILVENLEKKRLVSEMKCSIEMFSSRLEEVMKEKDTLKIDQLKCWGKGKYRTRAKLAYEIHQAF